MTIDLSQFHQVFFEESFEGLEAMETSLMELDPESLDLETINTIFRSAHSIKGGGATFGFKALSEFTHDMETILDQIRDGQRNITPDNINTFLESVDCMRDMLERLQNGEDANTEASERLKAHFHGLLEGPGNDNPEGDTVVQETAEAVAGQWKIQFSPEKDIFQKGDDALRIIQELEALGHIEEIACHSTLPDFSDFLPELCYLKWELVLRTSVPEAEVRRVFEWFDDSEIVLEAQQAQTHWIIDFIPGPGILQTGNEPIRLFTILGEFGKTVVTADTSALPDISDFNPEECFLQWQIDLYSRTASKIDIFEVFEWVADDSEISIQVVAGDGNGQTAQDASSQAPIIQSVKTPSPTPKVDDKADIPSAVGAPAAETGSGSPGKSKQAAVTARKETGESTSIRVGIDKIDNLINMVGELVITQSMLGELGTNFDEKKLPKLIEGLGQLEQNTRELQESVMRIRMLPISFAFSRFPRMIRDLSQRLEKEINLVVMGEQTELDKTVMEKIGDPLVHLVRNAADHGIEQPEERERAGKPRMGTVTLNAYHQSGNVVIEIKDDGKGLNSDALVEKALKKELISEEESRHMTEEHAFDLIFHPGFSTASEVSDVSGRGVGMDVVKRNIQALNGAVEVSSKRGQGSTITIRLPLTLAILDGQLIRVGSNIYVFPLVSIVESMQYNTDIVSDIAGGCNVFLLRDDYIPIVELNKTFDVKADDMDQNNALMVVVESDGEKIGIVVDELLAQQQVVIKSLEQNYKKIDGISGATILGDGTVALILDIPGILGLAGTNFNELKRMTAEASSPGAPSLKVASG